MLTKRANYWYERYRPMGKETSFSGRVVATFQKEKLWKEMCLPKIFRFINYDKHQADIWKIKEFSEKTKIRKLENK